jgi:hypothetical protein
MYGEFVVGDDESGRFRREPGEVSEGSERCSSD